jgi:cell division initiation protein
MKITPIDIGHKSFSKKMWGADEAEVNDFLQQVAAAMEELIRERNTLKEQLRDKDLRLKDSNDRDSVLKNTISTAGQMVERLRGDAEREAKLIVADAHQKAEMIVRDSRDSLKKAYTEISDLKRMRMQFQANLKALAQAHLSLVEQGERYMPSAALPNATMENETTTQISPLASK